MKNKKVEKVEVEGELKETVTETKPTEEKVEPVAQAPVDKSIYLEKTSKDADDFSEEIETERKKIFESYSKNKKVSTIMTFIVVALVIGALITIIQDLSWVKIIGYVLAGLAILVLISSYVIRKKAFPFDTKIYIKKVTKLFDEKIFSNGLFTDCKVDVDEKYQLSEVLCDRVYKDVTDVGSRNIVHGYYDKKSFTCGELALYVPGEGKKGTKKVCFLGKYITFANNLNIEGRYILLNKKEGTDVVDLPNDHDDLEVLKEDGSFIMYGANNNKDGVPAKFISEFKKIKAENALMNLVCVVWGGHTAFYMSYDDPVVSIPFEKPYDPLPHLQFKKNLEEVMALANTINK